MIIRIEDDKDLSILLRKHKKYKEEYILNVYHQGYEHLVLEKFIK